MVRAGGRPARGGQAGGQRRPQQRGVAAGGRGERQRGPRRRRFAEGGGGVAGQPQVLGRHRRHHRRRPPRRLQRAPAGHRGQRQGGTGDGAHAIGVAGAAQGEREGQHTSRPSAGSPSPARRWRRGAAPRPPTGRAGRRPSTTRYRKMAGAVPGSIRSAERRGVDGVGEATGHGRDRRPRGVGGRGAVRQYTPPGGPGTENDRCQEGDRRGAGRCALAVRSVAPGPLARHAPGRLRRQRLRRRHRRSGQGLRSDGDGRRRADRLPAHRPRRLLDGAGAAGVRLVAGPLGAPPAHRPLRRRRLRIFQPPRAAGHRRP